MHCLICRPLHRWVFDIQPRFVRFISQVVRGEMYLSKSVREV